MPTSSSPSSLSAAPSASASKPGPPVRKRARLDSAGDGETAIDDQAKSEHAHPPPPPSNNLAQYRLNDMADAEVYHLPNIVPLEEARAWYDALSGLDTWYQPTLKIYGREVVQSRKIAAYTTSPTLTLRYSGQLVDMHRGPSYPPLLRDIQERVEKVAGVEFNHVMLNFYEDGGVYIGRHRDNLENRVIASLSLGAPRTFVMTRDLKARERAGGKGKGKNKRSKPDSDANDKGGVDKKTIVLQPGSLVIMQGETQRWWKHEIPREPKVKQGRISLTFRQLEEA